MINVTLWKGSEMEVLMCTATTATLKSPNVTVSDMRGKSRLSYQRNVLSVVFLQFHGLQHYLVHYLVEPAQRAKNKKNYKLNMSKCE